MNWYDAQRLMATARDKSKGKPIANNTRLWENNYGNVGSYYITLHGNMIVKIFQEGNEYFHAGWRTVTTKERLNRYMHRHHIIQMDWVWYVRDLHVDVGEDWHKNLPEFYNGMFISNDNVMYRDKIDYMLRPLDVVA